MANEDNRNEKDLAGSEGLIHDSAKAEHMAYAEDPHRTAVANFMKLAMKAADNIESGDASIVQNDDEHDGPIRGWRDNLSVVPTHDNLRAEMPRRQQAYDSEHRDALISVTSGHEKAEQKHGYKSVKLSHEEIADEAIRLRNKARESIEPAADHAATVYDQKQAEQKAKADDIRKRLED